MALLSESQVFRPYIDKRLWMGIESKNKWEALL